jgi:NAD(P)-dependent dehydrogenase (short-subunit alcohol dehydrogenase family)
MDLNLRGKLALVTAASRGISLACAGQLADGKNEATAAMVDLLTA